jgi:hypothetical protein
MALVLKVAPREVIKINGARVTTEKTITLVVLDYADVERLDPDGETKWASRRKSE